jgi:hypothetical protein
LNRERLPPHTSTIIDIIAKSMVRRINVRTNSTQRA